VASCMAGVTASNVVIVNVSDAPSSRRRSLLGLSSGAMSSLAASPSSAAAGILSSYTVSVASRYSQSDLQSQLTASTTNGFFNKQLTSFAQMHSAAGFVNATSQALVIFTSAPTRAPSRAPVPQKSPSSSPGNGLGVGAIAGLAIMLILVSVALCVCVFYFFFRKSLPTGHPGTSSRIDSAESGTRNSFSKSNSQDDKVILEINALTYDSAYARSDEFVSFESPSKRPASSRLNVMVPSPTDCTAVELAPLSTGDIAV